MEFFFTFLFCFSLVEPAAFADSDGQKSAYATSLFDSASKKLTHHNSCSCEITPPSFCQALEAYPRKDMEAFGGESSGICERVRRYEENDPTRKHPFKRESLDECRPEQQNKNRYSSAFKAPSISQMHDKGYEVAKPEEVALYIKNAENIRDSYAPACCGDDRTCLAAVKRVDVRICNSPATPGAPDTCARGGHFTMSYLERSLLENKELDKALTFADKPHRDWIERQKHSLIWLSEVWYQETRKEQKVQWAVFPYAGRIVLSDYKYRSATDLRWIDSTETIQHELSHACSSIKRQVAMSEAKKEDSFEAAQHTLFDRSKDEYCNMQDKRDGYRNLFKDFLGKGGDEFTDCIEGLGVVAYRGYLDRPACVNACPASYFEETFAELGAWKAENYKGMESSICFGGRDSYHPLDSDILECAAQYVPTLKSAVLTGSECK